MSSEVNNSRVPNISPDISSPQKVSQDSGLLRLPLEIIARIGIFLTPSESARLSITCTNALQFESNIEEQWRGVFRKEMRQVFSVVPIEADKHEIYGAIDGLTLQNIEQTKDEIAILLLMLLLCLSDEEADNLPAVEAMSHFAYRYENILSLLNQVRTARQESAETPDHEKCWKYSKQNIICRTLAQEQRFAEALIIANLLPNDDELKNATVSVISIGLAKAQRIDEALLVAEMIVPPGDHHGAAAYGFICVWLAKAQLFDRALNIAEKVTFELNHRAGILESISHYADEISDEKERARIFELIDRAGRRPTDQ